MEIITYNKNPAILHTLVASGTCILFFSATGPNNLVKAMAASLTINRKKENPTVLVRETHYSLAKTEEPYRQINLENNGLTSLTMLHPGFLPKNDTNAKSPVYFLGPEDGSMPEHFAARLARVVPYPVFEQWGPGIWQSIKPQWYSLQKLYHIGPYKGYHLNRDAAWETILTDVIGRFYGKA